MPLFHRPPPAPPLSQSLALLHGAAKSWGETHIEGGVSSAGQPTASVVVKELASIAHTSISQRVKTDVVAFGFAVAAACLLIIAALAALCRLYRRCCRPSYSGVDLAEVRATR